jgi:hypothetical protein
MSDRESHTLVDDRAKLNKNQLQVTTTSAHSSVKSICAGSRAGKPSCNEWLSYHSTVHDMQVQGRFNARSNAPLLG